MLTFILYFFSTSTAVPTACEELGPRLDGSYVTVCAGNVVGVRDGLGNSRAWDPATRAITVRAPGAQPLLLEAAPARIRLLP
jgi:hypothetical protein